jgi:hypothetical protein
VQIPGGRSRNFRLGDRSELLVQNLLTGIAFTTPVPRQEDIGIDFICSLITGYGKGGLLNAGSVFTVQAKGNDDPIIYAKAHEVEWITYQENPLLICVADRNAGAMDVYSTWNLLCAVQNGWRGKKVPDRIRLLPGQTGAIWPGVVDHDDGSQDIYLDKPIIRVEHNQIFDETKMAAAVEIINEWVRLDRLNIVNRYAGLNWIVGPLIYDTGQAPGAQVASFYWNRNNLEQCVLNLGRSATAVWRILSDFGMPSDPVAQKEFIACMPHIRELLKSLLAFDPSLKDFLRDI